MMSSICFGFIVGGGNTLDPGNPGRTLLLLEYYLFKGRGVMGTLPLIVAYFGAHFMKRAEVFSWESFNVLLHQHFHHHCQG